MNPKIAEIIRDEDFFVVVTHVNPDGDAIGSLLGLTNALLESGKHACALTAAPIPIVYTFLPGSESILTNSREVPFQPKWIVALDAAEKSRIAGDISLFDSASLINIDHHSTNPNFGDLNYVNAAAMSTAELAHEVLKKAGYVVSRPVGICLFAGLISDTGGFRFAGVNSDTLRVGAEMLAPGIDVYEVTEPLYEEFPLHRLELERLMLERCEILLNGKVVLSAIYHTDLEKLGASMSDTEHFVNKLRGFKGVRVGGLITQMPNIIRVSLRGKGVNVASIAQTLGGGGHPYAAGIKSNLSLQELRDKLLSAIRDEIDRTPL
jgi:bifunctional oligoribonuclease and PAP phosphatase NrnA